MKTKMHRQQSRRIIARDRTRAPSQRRIRTEDGPALALLHAGGCVWSLSVVEDFLNLRLPLES